VLVIALSVLLGAAGLLVTRPLAARLASRTEELDPHAPWAIGLAGMLPAWLAVFLALLPATAGARPRGLAEAAWILSAASALLGAIASESRLRAIADGRETPPVRCWRLGALAMVPAWAVALAGFLAALRPVS
jgi:hypothetical protein